MPPAGNLQTPVQCWIKYSLSSGERDPKASQNHSRLLLFTWTRMLTFFCSYSTKINEEVLDISVVPSARSLSYEAVNFLIYLRGRTFLNPSIKALAWWLICFTIISYIFYLVNLIKSSRLSFVTALSAPPGTNSISYPTFKTFRPLITFSESFSCSMNYMSLRIYYLLDILLTVNSGLSPALAINFLSL
jgi:hypothetical protein